MEYLLYTAVFAATVCAVFGIATAFQPKLAADRAAEPTLRRGGSALDGFVSRSIGGLDADTTGALARWLLQAGYASPDAVRAYQLARIVLGMGSALLLGAVLAVSGLHWTSVVPLMAVAALIGLLLPAWLVRRRREQRQQGFRKGLPDMLDLLLVCTEAGMGIDSALAKVAEELARTRPLLAEQLVKISDELRAGRSRADAMTGFAIRTGIEETASLVNLLVQSDALGTSMADTLRVFAEDMRGHRLLKAEERGHTVTVKLTLVLAGCFLPAILIAILAPVVFRIMAGLSKLVVPS